MDVADIAGRGFSPATGYSIPAGTLDQFDEAHRRVVTALARDLQAVQSLHLYPGADKAATLVAITDAA
ncbi:hypothetical protein, partial [Mycobacterium avium]